MTYNFNIARRLFWRELAFIALCIGIGWLCGLAVSAALVYFLFEPGDGYVSMGAFFGLLGLFVAVVACRNQNANTRYHLAVSMGQSRRGYLATEIIVKFLQCLLGLVLVGALTLLELGVVNLLFPGLADVSALLGETGAGEIALEVCGISLAFVAIDLVITALMVRFGMKGFFIVFIPIWLNSLLASPSIHAAEENTGSILAALGHFLIWAADVLSAAPPWAVVGVPALLLSVISILYLLRAPVKL